MRQKIGIQSNTWKIQSRQGNLYDGRIQILS